MPLKGLAGGLYRPLSPEDITTIHEASLTILENIGMTYERGLEAVLDMAEGKGAKVTAKNPGSILTGIWWQPRQLWPRNRCFFTVAMEKMTWT